MEHLKLPNTALHVIRDIPYVLPEDYGFEERVDFGSIRDQRVRSNAELNCLTQSLWFGLGQGVLGQAFSPEAFTRTNAKGKLITTRALPKITTQWITNQQRKSPFEQAARAEQLKAIFSAIPISLEHLNRDQDLISPLTASIMCAVCTLAEYLLQAARMALHPYMSISLRLATKAFLCDSQAVRRHLQEMLEGDPWCECERRILAHEVTSVSALYYRINMLPPEPPGGPWPTNPHASCDGARLSCRLYKIDPDKYETKHTTIGCACAKGAPNQAAIETVLQSSPDAIPLLTVDEEENGRVQCDVENSLDGHSYVAISHVWADGMGDPVHNKLPLCILRKLQGYIEALERDMSSPIITAESDSNEMVESEDFVNLFRALDLDMSAVDLPTTGGSEDKVIDEFQRLSINDSGLTTRHMLNNSALMKALDGLVKRSWQDFADTPGIVRLCSTILIHTMLPLLHPMWNTFDDGNALFGPLDGPVGTGDLDARTCFRVLLRFFRSEESKVIFNMAAALEKDSKMQTMKNVAMRRLSAIESSIFPPHTSPERKVNDEPNEGLKLWIDTLCCPVDPTLKKLALARMKQTYENATYVLIVDSSLEKLDTDQYSSIELLMRLFTSPWMRRLWTLQEGVCAQRLLVRFSDRAVAVQTLFDQVATDNDIATKCLLGEIETLYASMVTIGGQRGDRIQPLQRKLQTALFGRSVSVPSDEVICIANLLRLDLKHLFYRFPPQMEQIWDLVNSIPSSVVFVTGQRLSTPGYRWAPQSFLSMSSITQYQNDIILSKLPAERLRHPNSKALKGLQTILPGYWSAKLPANLPGCLHLRDGVEETTWWQVQRLTFAEAEVEAVESPLDMYAILTSAKEASCECGAKVHDLGGIFTRRSHVSWLRAVYVVVERFDDSGAAWVRIQHDFKIRKVKTSIAFDAIRRCAESIHSLKHTYDTFSDEYLKYRTKLSDDTIVELANTGDLAQPTYNCFGHVIGEPPTADQRSVFEEMLDEQLKVWQTRAPSSRNLSAPTSGQKWIFH